MHEQHIIGCVREEFLVYLIRAECFQTFVHLAFMAHGRPDISHHEVGVFDCFACAFHQLGIVG